MRSQTLGYYQPGPPDGWGQAWDTDPTEWGQCCLVQDFWSGSSGDGWDLGADAGRDTLGLIQGVLQEGTPQKVTVQFGQWLELRDGASSCGRTVVVVAGWWQWQ